MTDAMNRQHAIDHAEFDTTFTRRADPRQQESLDDFVRTELMRPLPVISPKFDNPLPPNELKGPPI